MHAIRYSMRCFCFSFTLIAVFSPVAAQEKSDSENDTVVEPFLIAGKLDDGEVRLRSALKKSPDSDQLHMELGFLQFFQAVEEMAQTLHGYGPRESFVMGQVPFLRFPVPKNPDPKPATLKGIRDMMQAFIYGLDEVDKTLAKIDSDDVKLSIRVMQVKLDFDGDGKASESENLSPVLMQYLAGRRRTSDQMKAMMDKSINFDRADVDWLRGYCCLLRSMSEVFLAYDETLFWDVVAHQLFENAPTQYDFLFEEMEARKDNNRFYFEIVDLVAGFHNIRFPLKEPERLKVAHQHLLDTIGHSRQMWKRINAETDDDHEWIPSPSQSNPFTGVRITRRMTDSWEKFLNEGEQILNGELLIPFWRGKNDKRGFDLRKAFYEPEDFDLVLWIHGSGAVPFIKIGDCSEPETWREFQRVFRGNFFGFAVWFN